MDHIPFNVDLESCTSFHLSNNGSFLKSSDTGKLLSFIKEMWLEETKTDQIRRNAKQCLMFRNGIRKDLLTGLKPCSEQRWFKGNILRFEAGKRTKIQIIVFISQNKTTIEIFKPLGRTKKTTGKEKSLPEAFISSQMRFHPDTRQR
jgi:hypothetical protein